jgi:hypothetical protein
VAVLDDGQVLAMTKKRTPTRLGIAGACVAGVGLLLVCVGTFLPWFRSGMVLRDSYVSIGVMRRIDLLDGGPLELLLDAWTAIIPVVTLCVVVYILGFRRASAAVSLIVAIFCGTIAGIAAVVGGGEEVQLGIDNTGPYVTFLGSVFALLGSLGVVIGQRTSAAESSGGEP